MSEQIRIDLYAGKYTYVYNMDGSSKALRYGEEWRDTIGDGLILAMAQRIQELESRPHTGTPDQAAVRLIADLQSLLKETIDLLESIPTEIAVHLTKFRYPLADELHGCLLQLPSLLRDQAE